MDLCGYFTAYHDTSVTSRAGQQQPLLSNKIGQPLFPGVPGFPGTRFSPDEIHQGVDGGESLVVAGVVRFNGVGSPRLDDHDQDHA